MNADSGTPIASGIVRRMNAEIDSNPSLTAAYVTQQLLTEIVKLEREAAALRADMDALEAALRCAEEAMRAHKWNLSHVDSLSGIAYVEITQALAAHGGKK